MSTESTLTEQEQQEPKEVHHGSGSSPVYGIGMIGAWVYYFKGATTFQQRVQAFFKGLAWPAFLVYDLLVFLKSQSDKP